MDITEYHMDPRMWNSVAEFIFTNGTWIEHMSVEDYLAKRYELHHTSGLCYKSTNPEKLIEFILKWA